MARYRWSEVQGFENVPADWRAHVLAFEADEDAAIAANRCFCICGCSNIGTLKVGWSEPQISYCIECSKLNTRKFDSSHRPAQDPSDTFVSDDGKRRAGEAKEFVSRSERKIARPTNPVQVERVLARRDREISRTRNAEKRSDKVAFTGRVDVSGVRKGSYVVVDERGKSVTLRVERPARGGWAGFTFIVVDPYNLTARGGMQRPGIGETYLGRFGHLIAQLPSARMVP